LTTAVEAHISSATRQDTLRINAAKFRLFYKEKKRIFSFSQVEILIKIVGSYSPFFEKSNVCFHIFRNIILKDGNAMLNSIKIKTSINKKLK
jgi:hypothetical protein